MLLTLSETETSLAIELAKACCRNYANESANRRNLMLPNSNTSRLGAGTLALAELSSLKKCSKIEKQRIEKANFKYN